MPPREYELAVVMPVDNDRRCVVGVHALGVGFAMPVIRDNSQDRTAGIVRSFTHIQDTTAHIR